MICIVLTMVFFIYPSDLQESVGGFLGLRTLLNTPTFFRIYRIIIAFQFFIVFFFYSTFSLSVILDSLLKTASRRNCGKVRFWRDYNATSYGFELRLCRYRIVRWTTRPCCWQFVNFWLKQTGIVFLTTYLIWRLNYVSNGFKSCLFFLL